MLFILSFMNRYHISHFPFSWEDSWLYTRTKIKCNGLQIALSQICTMRMLIWSCPCALLGSNFLITLKLSSLVKFIVSKDSFVLRNNWVGKVLPVSIWVHCFAKNELNNSLFSLKSTTNWLLWIKGGIQGIFFVTEKTL